MKKKRTFELGQKHLVDAMVHEFLDAYSLPDWDGYGSLPYDDHSLKLAVNFFKRIDIVNDFKNVDLVCEPSGRVAIIVDTYAGQTIIGFPCKDSDYSTLTVSTFIKDTADLFSSHESEEGAVAQLGHIK